jgi:hypothetical protein
MEPTKLKTPLPLGTKTRWGRIVAVSYCAERGRFDDREYTMLDGHDGAIARMPWGVVEAGRGGERE